MLLIIKSQKLVIVIRVEYLKKHMPALTTVWWFQHEEERDTCLKAQLHKRQNASCVVVFNAILVLN